MPTAVSPPSGLVSWWTADGTAADLLGLNHATPVSGATYAAGMVGQAFSLDGVDDRFQVADSESLKLTNSLTIEAWVLVDSLPAGAPANHGEILFRGDDRGGLDPYSLAVESNGRFQFLVSSLTEGMAIEAPVPILGQWTHVAGTLDDATGAMRLYVNGALAAENITEVRPFRDLDPASNPGIGIGNHGGHPTTPHNFPFDGLIDELSVYDRAITAAEVQGIYDAGSDGKIRMFVVQTSPDQGSVVSTAPTNFAVDFSFPYNASTLQANHFQVNGIPATSFALTDADTVSFAFAASPVTAEGLQTMRLDSGAVTNATDGLPVAAYDATFRYDALRMQVTSTDPAAGGSLTVQSFTGAATAVASMAGIQGNNTAWPVLYGSGAVGADGLRLAVDEDNLFDIERSHTTEQLAFIALDGAPSGNIAPFLRTGTVAGVTNAGWTTVTLDRSYASMVLVVTPNYTDTSPPLVARVRNAVGNSFEVKVDRTDGVTGTVAGVTVHYLVVEEGTYTTGTHGVRMEAIRFTSTVTDYGSRPDGTYSLVGESRNYAQSYDSPVVLGQVMSANDPAFSVFWARGAGSAAAPTSDALFVGKHVGEDPNTTRDPETIGYIVIEAGQGTIGGTAYLAAVGPDIVQGIDDRPPDTYQLTTANLRVNLNEAFDAASVSASDLSLNVGSVMSAAAVDADTVEYRLVGVPKDSTLAVAMVAGALIDGFGNSMLPFSATYLTGPTKFYVVNDNTTRNGIDRTYEYGPTGSSVENYALGSGNTAPRGAASSVAADRVWAVDANRNVYVYNSSGGMLGSWKLGGANGGIQIEGITTNGTDIWVVDNKLDIVVRYSNAAGALSGTVGWHSQFDLAAGNTNPKDLVTDGIHLWVVNDASTDKVFKYTLAGSLVGSWTISSGGGSPTGITLDPGAPAHLWIVDNATDRVYQYDNAVGLTSGSQAASTSFALAPGNTNPQGIADPPAPVGAGSQSGSPAEAGRVSETRAPLGRKWGLVRHLGDEKAGGGGSESALMTAASDDSFALNSLAPLGLDGSVALFGRFIFDPTLDTLKDIDPLNN